jgi:hypothetical protein
MPEEIYVSTDIEADGPIPGEYSMLSFGSAAFKKNKTLVSTFSANLKPLEGANEDADTMKWWKSQPHAWVECHKDQQDPEAAMKDYVTWLKKIPGKPVFVGYPATFDFMFIYWYLIKFEGESPFSFSAVDIKTYAMSLLKIDFRKIRKKVMPKDWFDSTRKTHVALEDAIDQGLLFCNMLAKNLE